MKCKINDYSFELDSVNQIHVYDSNMKYICYIPVEYWRELSFDEFKKICNEWIDAE